MKLYLLLLSLLMLSPLAGAGTAVENLNRQLSVMQSMQANFHQEIHGDKGELLQQASGEIIIQRPRKLYWSTEQPYQHLVVTDGETLWVYDIDLEQVSRQPFSAELDQAPALLLSGEIETISQYYSISEQSAGEGVHSFQLLPKLSDSVFQRMTIEFTRGVLQSMSLEDNFGQLTTIRFSDLRLNPTIAPRQFAFTPPAGVDVIVNEP